MVSAFSKGNYKASFLDGHSFIQQLSSSSTSSVRNSLGWDMVRLALKYSLHLNCMAEWKLFSLMAIDFKSPLNKVVR